MKKYFKNGVKVWIYENEENRYKMSLAKQIANKIEWYQTKEEIPINKNNILVCRRARKSLYKWGMIEQK